MNREPLVTIIKTPGENNVVVLSIETGSSYLGGWFIDCANKTEPASFLVYKNGELRFSGLNNGSRPDLKAQGISSGAGGFTTPISSSELVSGDRLKFSFPGAGLVADFLVGGEKLVHLGTCEMKSEFSRLQTRHGTCLSVSGSLLAHESAPEDPVLFLPVSNKLALLVPQSNLPGLASNDARLKLWKLFPRDNSNYVKLIRFSEQKDSHISFSCLPSLNSFASNAPAPGHASGKAEFIANCTGKAEAIQMLPSGSALSDQARAKLRQIRNLVLRPAEKPLPLEQASKIYLDVMIQRLDAASLAQYFGECFHETGKRQIKELFFDDSYIQLGLGEDKGISTGLDSRYDFLTDTYFTGSYGSPGHVVNQIYRSTFRHDRNVCILASARNEGPYLLEWIAHHRSLGITDIFIYSNNNDDGSEALLKELDSCHLIKYIPNNINTSQVAQARAYMHALNLNQDILRYQYVLMIDLDEFLYLNPDYFENIHDFLDYHRKFDADSIFINWVYGRGNNQLRYEDKPLIERFPFSSFDVHQCGKSLYKPQNMASGFCHYPLPRYGYGIKHIHSSGAEYTHVNIPDYAKSDPFSFSDCIDASKAVILHYIYKSFEEFIYKSGRNKGNSKFSSGINFSTMKPIFFDNFISLFESHYNGSLIIANSVVDNMRAELASLLSIGNVSLIHYNLLSDFRLSLGRYMDAFAKFCATNKPMNDRYMKFRNKFCVKMDK